MVATYAYIYVYELSAEAITWASIAKTPGVFIALPLLVPIQTNGKKEHHHHIHSDHESDDRATT